MGMITYKKGISLITLVITIVIIVILATAVIMNLLGDNNVIENAKNSVETSNKQTATEKMNLKLTTIQMDSYIEKQRLPILQEIATSLDNDDEVEEVSTSSKYKKNSNTEVASLSADINIGDSKSIYVTLNEFPYEFEINDSLQLASIDGVNLIADTNNKDVDSLKSEIIDELKNYIDSKINFASPKHVYKCSASYTSDYVKKGIHYINEENIFSNEESSDNYNTISKRDNEGYLKINESGIYVINTHGSTQGVLTFVSALEIYDSKKIKVGDMDIFVDYTHSFDYYHNTTDSITIYLEKGQYIKPRFSLEDDTKSKSFYVSIDISRCF